MATLTKGKTFTNGELVTPQKLHELVDLGTVSGIVNADISAGAAIADSKLATISTAGKVANSATTAASTNIANAIVARDASGNFSAGTITAALAGNASTATTAASCSGNAATATKLATARTLSLAGDVTGSATFDGSANASITAVVADDSHNHIIANVDGLQAALDGKQAAGSYAAASHTHDDRYYTETEVNTLLAGKLGTTATAAAATKLATARTISLTGAVTGSTTFDGSGNASITTTHTADPKITLTGDVTGSGTMTNLGNVSITATVADDSHNHVISNVDGLQTALDGKQAAGSYVTNGGSVSSIQRVTSMPASPAANTLYIVIP